jgi:hypothetical protein
MHRKPGWPYSLRSRYIGQNEGSRQIRLGGLDKSRPGERAARCETALAIVPLMMVRRVVVGYIVRIDGDIPDAIGGTQLNQRRCASRRLSCDRRQNGHAER